MKISRLENSLEEQDPFIQKTFTHKEREEAGRSENRNQYFASRFAGKEAVFKSLKIDGNTVRLNEIEILHSPCGAPEATLSGELKRMADEKGILSVEVTLSKEEDFVIAYAMALCKESEGEKNE